MKQLNKKHDYLSSHRPQMIILNIISLECVSLSLFVKHSMRINLINCTLGLVSYEYGCFIAVLVPEDGIFITFLVQILGIIVSLKP